MLAINICGSLYMVRYLLNTVFRIRDIFKLIRDWIVGYVQGVTDLDLLFSSVAFKISIKITF
jgi:hypothetical protein